MFSFDDATLQNVTLMLKYTKSGGGMLSANWRREPHLVVLNH